MKYIYGYDAEKIANVDTIGDLIPLLNTRTTFWVHNGCGHSFKLGTIKWLKLLPQDWKVNSLYDNSIKVDVDQETLENGCGKVLEAKGWRKDKYGFYSIRA